MKAPAPGPVPVLFVHYGADWIRGSERCLLDLVRGLDRTRYRPIAWCNAPALASALTALQVPVETSRFPVLLDWDPPRFDLRGFAALLRQGSDLVGRHGIRLVHANGGAPCQWMAPVTRRARIPLLVHLHANYDLRGRCIFGLHHVSRAVGVSRATVQALLDDGVAPERVQVIYNGIDARRLLRGEARGLRAALGIGADDVVLCSVGSLIPRKGFDLLLRAFAALRRSARNTRLLVIGDGPEREALPRLAVELGIAADVHFLGEREEVGAILRDAADLAVCASRDEALPLVVMEAQLAGLPVVATRVGGTAEALADGVAGLLVPPEDASALAGALLRIVSDTDLRHRLGAAGRARAEREFTVERMVGELCGSYDALLADAIPAPGLGGPWGPLRPWARLAGGMLRRRFHAARQP